MKRRIKNMGYFLYCVIAILLAAVSLIIYKLGYWVLDTWGLLSMDEIVFHLKVPLEGTSTDMVIEGINACVPMACLVILFMLVLVIGMRKKKLRGILSLFLIVCLCLSAGLQSLNTVYAELEIGDYLSNQSEESTFIQDEYVDPRSVKITFPEQKRNLIYIFLESMETTYMSVGEGGAFEENYIPELTVLAKENTSFSNTSLLGGASSVTGTSWTMAGLFAQTSGLPLKVSAEGDDINTTLGNNESFSSTAYNIQDILHENGYNQCFLLGSDATFGGRRAYFDAHGECEIWDYLTAKEEGKIPEDYYVWWGYEDEKLFSYAQEKLLELSATGEPFNLTMLTVDTHFEDGYVCDLCQNEFGDNQYANVMACSSRQIQAFIEWIQQQDFYENTTIVLCGDHLTMDSDFCTELDVDNYQRTVYNTFINLPDELEVSYEQTNNRQFSTMDMFPTTVSALGATIEGNRLGLGTSLFSGEQTIIEKYGLEYVNQELKRNSVFYNLLINDVDY